MSKIKKVFVLDVDGTLTDGRMYYTKEGKVMKSFGCDDFDSLKSLSKQVEIVFITADKKGFEISNKRAGEMSIPLYLVSNDPHERWKWIEDRYKDYIICFAGDGINDWLCLQKAWASYTVKDALPHTLSNAKFVINRRGGDRAVAEACIRIDGLLNLNCFPKEYYKCILLTLNSKN